MLTFKTQGKIGDAKSVYPNNPWAFYNHIYLPTPCILSSDKVRIYHSLLNKDKVGRVFSMDLDMNNPKSIFNTTHEPILYCGVRGHFDCDGVSPSQVITINNSRYLLYIGWQRSTAVPYFLFSGLASLRGSTAYNSKVPLLDRAEYCSQVRSAPFLLQHLGYNYLFYIGGDRWGATTDGKWVPHYEIRMTILDNNLVEHKESDKLIVPKKIDELGLGRPWITRVRNIWYMFYSIRTIDNRYKLGMATSNTLRTWVRVDDQLQINTDGNWDSQMQCFASVLNLNDNKLLMFYSGNNFGEGGLGYAIANISNVNS